MVGREYEAGGIAKDGAKMVMAVACAEVPKFTVIVGGSFGAGQLRDGRSRLRTAVPLVLAEQPDQRDGRAPGGARAVDRPGGVACPAARGHPTTDRDGFEAPILERYEAEGDPYFATARLWDDGVIDPLDTRRVLALGLEAALHAPIPETRFGVFRM